MHARFVSKIVLSRITKQASCHGLRPAARQCKNMFYVLCYTTHATAPAVSDISISFFDEASGDTTTLSVPTGKSVLDVAIENNLNIEGNCGYCADH